MRTYHNFYSFSKHLRRKHQNTLVDLEQEGEEFCTENNQQSTKNFDVTSSSQERQTEPTCTAWRFQQKNSALFLLKAREVHKVSQTALNEITSEFTAMSSSELNKLKVKMLSAITAARAIPECIRETAEAFRDNRLNNPYKNLETEYQQRQYYKQNLNLVVFHFHAI